MRSVQSPDGVAVRASRPWPLVAALAAFILSAAALSLTACTFEVESDNTAAGKVGARGGVIPPRPLAPRASSTVRTTTPDGSTRCESSDVDCPDGVCPVPVR